MKYNNNNDCNEKEYNKKKKRGAEKRENNPNDAQRNCSPPADQCLSSDPPIPANSPLFIYWA